MSASIIELERDIEAARARLDQTLETIQGRLTLSGVVDEIIGAASRNNAPLGIEGALGLAKRNPLPIMLVAAGVGWLIHRMAANARAARLDEIDLDLDAPLLNVGQSRIYDPDVSSRHPGQDALETRRDLAAQA